MTITTCQKVTLISCSVLCISLFLPRMILPGEKKEEQGLPKVGPGFYRAVMHQLPPSGDPERWDVDPSPSLTHTVEAFVKVRAGGRGKKYNLMAQVIPIYGFGILLYILYILHKLTCKKTPGRSGYFTAKTNTTLYTKSTIDSELIRLQERLLQTERKLDRIVSGRSNSSSSGRKRKNKNSISKKEEKLLRELRQITLLMQEGRLDGASPEMEAEEMSYGADWEGYPEETYPKYEKSCHRPKVNAVPLSLPPCQQTAEALAEHMEQMEEEVVGRKLATVQEEDEDEEDTEDEDVDEEEEVEEELKDSEVEDVEEVIDVQMEEEGEEEEGEEVAEQRCLLPVSPSTGVTKQERIGLEVSKELQSHRKQITFSEHKKVFHYPKQDTYDEDEDRKEDDTGEEETDAEDEEEEADEDDPLMEAESLLFICEETSNPDQDDKEEEEDEDMFTSDSSNSPTPPEVSKEVGVSGLRMRNRRET